MQMNTQDYLKKALLDTQERIRDYMSYSKAVQTEELRNCFQEFAEMEGMHASKLQELVRKYGKEPSNA
jgi:rubrerythrin